MSNNGCGQLGAIQTRGTCWFYSILNGFILSEDGQKIMYSKLKEFYKKLKPVEKAYFDDELNAPCPMKNLSKTKEIYFWKFIDQYLCFMSGPRAVSLKAGKSAELLGGMSLQGTVAKLNQGGKGAYPQIEIEKVLDHLGFAKDYYVKYATDPHKFHAGRKPQFVIVRQNKYYPENYMDRIPEGLMDDPKYSLMCATLVILNTEAKATEMHRGHAVAGFVCNGNGYIYDSNQRKIFKCDWWVRSKMVKTIIEEVSQMYQHFKGGQITYYGYAFAIFSRKEFTKDIGVSCLMKYKTETPQAYGLNFTNPNLGSQLNSKKYNFFKPAQRAALKRKWARTEHKAPVYLNRATFNSIVAGAKSRNNALDQLNALRLANYKYRDENYNEFAKKLKAKFPIKLAPNKPSTFANVKARLNQFTKSTAAVRKHQYSLVWRGLPMTQRKVLMHWRNKGEWLTNNAFENKPKPPIKRKSVVKPKTPSPSPRTKRAIQVKANFEKYWKSMQPENRRMIRNYVAAYKSPNANALAKFFEPAKKPYTLANAKRNVNALTTAKARKEFYRTGTVGKGLNPTNLVVLSKYIKAKNQAAKNARAAKKSVAK